ncbi:MAG: methyltransferase domain-containing protein [Alphaproteobacteria bacterium]|nr:methyltransferase domain-containing protein [Alphaproteobacteria bacterium]
MTPAARMAASLELLEIVEQTPRPADALVSSFFRARRYMGAKDRAFIAQLVYDLLRHHARLNWWLEKLGFESKPRHRMIVYLKLVDKKSAQEIDQIFSGELYSPALLDEAEKKLLAALKGHTLLHPAMTLQTYGECPAWAYEPLSAHFGKTLEEELAALLRAAPLDLRVNPLKITREDALAQLKEAGLDAGITPYAPFGLRVNNRPSLGQIALLKNGALEIQDEGSQLVALLLDAKAGERIVDFCAGAGGKTLAMAAMMENKGRIMACDVLASRLKRSAERFRRAGFHNIQIHALSSERDPWVRRHKGAFDRVLVDAPCSGTGTWRRNPDARWKNLGPGLEALVPLQTSILQSAARLVRPEGRLVYATCSLLPQENEEQITRFLDNNPDFSLIPARSASAELTSLPASGPYLALSPARHNTDGFFAAIMQRQSSPE